MESAGDGKLYCYREEALTVLKTSAVSGFKWSTASQVSRQVMGLATTIVLARLLTPADFGLLGMATVVTGFIALFHGLGTAAAVIQRKELSEALLSSVFWVNVGFGALAMLLLYLFSPLFAYIYQEPRVAPLLQLLSVTLFFSGLSIMQQALLEKSLAFDRLAKLEIVATLIGAAVGIVSALLGYGPWSLVYQALAVTFATTVLLWAANSWRPKFTFHLQEVLSVSGFSLNLAGFNIFNYFVRNADYLLIGRYLGASDLGIYTLAYRIMLYPLQNISAVISRVMFPLFSQIQEDLPRFRSVYLLVTGAIALVTFPVMFGLLALTEPFVFVMFGPQWQPVVWLLKILVPVGMIQSIVATVGPIYQAKGRTDILFRWGVCSGVLAVLAFVIGLRWGIMGVASAYAVVSIVLVYPAFAIPFKFISLSVIALLKVLWRPFLCSSLMFVFLFLVELFIPSFPSNINLLCTMVPAGVLTYALLTKFLNWEKASEIFQIARGKA